jgi:hypothetical protein
MPNNNIRAISTTYLLLKTYRYRGRYGWIYIGAVDTEEALMEAARSTDEELSVERLYVFNEQSLQYEKAST